MSWEHFTYEEFECRCGCGTNEMDLDFITDYDAMRRILGFPIRINSGYRCPNHPDEREKQNGPGPHTTGLAADPTLSYLEGFRFLELAFKQRIFTGYGFSQRGNVRFLHTDKCEAKVGRPRPHIWSY